MMQETKRKIISRQMLFIAVASLVLVNLLESTSSSLQRALERANAYVEDLDLDVVSNNVANVNDPVNTGRETAIYWHIHKASGSSIKGYYGCLGKVLGTRYNEDKNHPQNELSVYDGPNNGKFVNVDTTSVAGLQRAKELGLAESGMVDIVVTNLVAVAMDVFTPENQGRLFALFRHPIERAASLYYYRQVASWEQGEGVYRPDLADVSIETFYERMRQRGDTDDIVLSKLLNKDRTDVLTDEDLEKGKEILRNKMLVGLTDKMEESLNRFDTYFGWYQNPKREICRSRVVNVKVNSNSHPRVEKGSKAWEHMARVMSYDMKLYEYAVELFQEQTELFWKHNNFDMVKEQ